MLRSLIASLALCLAATGLAKAQAGTQLCVQLESDLAALKAGGGLNDQLTRYDRAIEAQERQLLVGEEQWARAGCGYARRDAPASICEEIEGRLSAMDRNYDSLVVERQALLQAPDPRESEADLEAAIAQAECRADPLPETVAVQPQAAETDRYRTVCVRACDGYFFPMSYGIAQGDFGRDERSCQATCPGTDMRLYIHKVPAEETSSMVSAVSGEPYSALPTANRYREPNANLVCGCGQNGSTVAGRTPNASSIITLPVPDTQQSASIGTAEAPSRPAPPQLEIKPVSPEAVPREMTEADRQVRTVGPQFLPDQEEALDLRSPGQTSDR